MPRIPQNKQWIGMRQGNYAGNLWATWNIDLEKTSGRLALSDKLRRFSTGLGVVHKFIRTNATTTDQWFGMVHNTDILRNGSSTITAGTWVTDDTVGTFNDPRDMILHESANGEQRLLCSRATDIAILNSTGVANAWDADWYTAVLSASALTSLTHHPMARLQRLVAIGDKVSNTPVIHTIDSSDTVTESRLSFPPDFTVRVAYTNSNRFWFGLENDVEGHAKVIEWDGSSSTYNFEYDLIGSTPLCGFMVDDVPYFITEKGFIMKYTGGGFRVIQDFNLQEQRMVFSSSLTSESTITPYGSFVDRDLVYLNAGIPVISPTVDKDTLTLGVRKARSGLWIFNTRNRNLYQHMGIGQHTSAGTDVDYGHGYLDQVGAVLKAKVGDDRILIASASVFTGGATWLTTPANGIYRMIQNVDRTSDAGRNRGYFITSYIPYSEAEAMWDALWLKFKRFQLTAGDSTTEDRIVVKWRVQDPLFEADAQDPNSNVNALFNAQGTWINTISFTCKVPTGVTVGDEVEIMTGDNGGCVFKVSALSATPDNTTAITVTIDEAAPTSSTDTFLCRFDNWNGETAISSTTIGNKRVPFTATTQGEFLQLKVELRGFEVEIDELFPTLKPKTNYSQA